MDFAIEHVESEAALMSPGDFMAYVGYGIAVAGFVAMIC
ncbi:hypothetical protein GALL_358830 [mine drainage metagenome]|uniref:Uncharacterized protein n=1 Tax=mine drainage metagenome TaxID=410659 RepID=A0A1J5QFL9_9ZZZZ